jgi:hypothetical protein
MFYPHIKDYLTKLYIQSSEGTLFNSMDDLAWDVVDVQAIHHYDHRNRAGLQWAVVASSIYQGLSEATGRRRCLDYARILSPILALNTDGSPWGVGLKFMPNYLRADLRLMASLSNPGKCSQRVPCYGLSIAGGNCGRRM